MRLLKNTSSLFIIETSTGQVAQRLGMLSFKYTSFPCEIVLTKNTWKEQFPLIPQIAVMNAEI